MSALAAMPFARWAARFRSVELELTGRIGVRQVKLYATGVGTTITSLYSVENGERCMLQPSQAMTLVRQLSDTTIDVVGVAGSDLLIKLGLGLTASVGAGESIRLEGNALGPPERLVLCEPLFATVSGAGLVVGKSWFSVRVSAARLAPDGEVSLVSPSRLGAATLKLASKQLTIWVRTHERFAAVRRFLRVR